MGTEIQVGNVNEDVELLKAQAEIYNHLFAYAETLALRSVVELRIPDIIHSHGHPMSLSQIASKLESPSLDVTCLARVMRMLVRKKVFTIDYNQLSLGDEDKAMYGLTTTSKWLLHDKNLSLAYVFLSYTQQAIVKPWFEISRSIKEGGNPFEKAHGESLWEMAYKNSEFNNMFNVTMAATTKPTLDAIIKEYKEGFHKLEGTIVDVGGGIGKLVAKIVETYPHIRGINFDLPHVIADAPLYPGVTHVSGDIFQDIPSTNNIIIKSVLHDWSDEDCLKILRNCQRAVSQKKGRVIIVEVVLHPDRHEMFDDAAVAHDLLMMTCIGGKERTEVEWKKLLKEAGFTHINIIPLQTVMSFSVIEAFCM